MQYQSEQQQISSEDELLREEAKHHDELYETAYPFWSDSLEVDPERVWSIYNRCYSPETHIHGYRKRRMLELIGINDLDGKSVLDVGCGNGQHAVFFAMHGADVHGYDISENGVKMARAAAEANNVSEKCNFSVQSASYISYPDKTFDVVLTSSVLHHIWKYDGVRDELYRVLRPGGSLVFDEGMRSNPLYRVARDTYRWATNSTQELGDIDLEYSDIIEYGDRFSSTTVECFTLLSGIKNLIGNTFENPSYYRRLFKLLSAVDAALESPAVSNPYCLDIVGKFENKRIQESPL